MPAPFPGGHALVVGVGADLPDTVTDARAIASILRNPARCGYPEDQVRELTSDDATRAALLGALEEIADATVGSDTVILYFSGHGYRVEATTTQFFLMPFGYDVAQLEETAISDSELSQALRRIESGRLLLILDCCHAGGVGDIKAPGVVLAKAPMPDDVANVMRKGSGRVIIASSRADELSYAGHPYSAFTSALLEALSGVGTSRQDGYVRVSDLALHARETVPRRTQQLQHPILEFEGADDFVVALYAGGEATPKAPPYAGEPVIDLSGRSGPGPTATGYAPGAVRRFAMAALSDGDLDDLCLDHFPRVYEQLAGGMSKQDKVRRLVDHAMRQDRLGELVDHVRDLSPAMYDHYAADLVPDR
jgi:hypothetical protein